MKPPIIFPHIVNGKIKDGLIYKIPSYCQNICKDFECHQIKNTLSYCSKGFGYISHNGLLYTLHITGLVIDTSSSMPSYLKKQFSHLKISTDLLTIWFNEMKELERFTIQYSEENVKIHLNSLHDIRHIIATLMRTSETLIREQPGKNFDEKLDKSNQHIITLYKSSSLLRDQIETISLLANPHSASFGGKNSSNIYQLVDKLVKMYRVLAKDKKCHLKLDGNSYAQKEIYDSFITIPLVLIDNAIKYSLKSGEITITIYEILDKIKISIRTYSPKIDDVDKIFEKGYRDKYAPNISSRGGGLGLYLAKIVADAHDIKIEHQSTSDITNISGIPYCNNTFSFTL